MTYPFKIKQESMPRVFTQSFSESPFHESKPQNELDSSMKSYENKHELAWAASALTSLAKPISKSSAAKVSAKSSLETAENQSNEDEIPMTFPQKLIDILSNDDHSDIISWVNNGRCFAIYQKKRFANEVLPRYFRQSKFTSFTRKMSRWGFIRIKRGPAVGAYYHKLFQRDSPHLCRQMTCQSNSSKCVMEIAAHRSNMEPYITQHDPARTNPYNVPFCEGATCIDHSNNTSQKAALMEVMENQIRTLKLSQEHTPAVQEPLAPAALAYEEYSASIVDAAIKALQQDGTSTMLPTNSKQALVHIMSTKERMKVISDNLRKARINRQIPNQLHQAQAA
mmetsp:Transcript_11758/g.14625  ORF Transcript_11758/g.14625 Transcript_11758/m.14625 type:complete len:338 (+) Transcript_11758:105-1118(+)|eukprot:CAMPEP_0172506390 /NCGR_PEP_ID=MMETSP1066-20121228/194676_1 /TAXON_ID=671091 /ORGANISM="Coscinodiscus wailesii, Strain CCMP2513" /LENGTH=337 /DNA_ID=CAMNT_0013283405 /DNA_START=93 /DNA_END=1106 /DNA_ORIENTATION=-